MSAPASVISLFGSTLKSKNGTVDTSTALANKEAIGIYFSAHWCPPCRGFTPKLGKNYEALKAAGKDVEIVFVSSDSNESAFDEYHAEMPFLALPYSLRDKKGELSTKFGVSGIPTLVFIDGKTGKTITDEGRGAISAPSFVEDFPYHPKPVYDLSESLGGINSNAALVVLCENADADTQSEIKTTTLHIAEAELAKSEPRVSKFFTGCGGGPIGQIRSNCGLAKAKECMVILDLKNDGAVYHPAPGAEAITEANIETFMAAFKAGSLKKGQWGK